MKRDAEISRMSQDVRQKMWQFPCVVDKLYAMMCPKAKGKCKITLCQQERKVETGGKRGDK